MTYQSCNDCAKQSTCPKTANFENYSLDGCMDFAEKENDNVELES